jgi:DNA-binding XRE family transcriptional regulator
LAKKNAPYLKLKGLRVEKGLTGDKMAGLLGISEATYRRKENRTDGSDFFLDEAKRVATILGVEPRDIFFTQ